MRSCPPKTELDWGVFQPSNRSLQDGGGAKMGNVFLDPDTRKIAFKYLTRCRERILAIHASGRCPLRNYGMSLRTIGGVVAPKVFLRVSSRYVVVRIDDMKECRSLTFARPFPDPQASRPKFPIVVGYRSGTHYCSVLHMRFIRKKTSMV
ncbi:hypothetical protein HD553DRAFT_317806 [Filobasidium floriforme]|uniref:uncharacterized protein n=1 Tax=Filobasidium floriforme TaxID=5210 RepID=UPI001E8D837A|nr:uncharacterized protein HD553DRAFT_317806 [Filobasidium floriforme]KAH8079864.1 hypothetical protein HD553DRAFT_317806 [Filobasidium floriforme]